MARAAHLAILGGPRVRSRPFPRYDPIGPEEKRAVNDVLDSGELSGFVGTWSDAFYGGPRVRELERAWAEHFEVRHAISMNSATSALYAAVGACAAGPGDEVVVSPFTMSASAAGVLLYGATPVFADIDPRTYCISAATIAPVLTPRTRAIIAVDIFGHPVDFDAINDLARRHGILVIEDAAQAPGATYRGRRAGTLADIGVYSLNYHKTIHTGEGGVAVTNDDRLAERLQLIRNHAEAVVGAKGVTDDHDLIGFNFRLPEIEAAIATAQLAKLERLTEARTRAADVLRRRWAGIPGLEPAWVQPDCGHSFYVLAVQYDAASFGVPRRAFVEAVRAEGVQLEEGYVEPLYLQPIYQRRASSCGPACPRYHGIVSYERGICPTAERMHDERLFYTTLVHAAMGEDDLDDVARAVEKVAEGVGQLAALEQHA